MNGSDGKSASHHATHKQGCGCLDMQLIDVLEIAQEEWEDNRGVSNLFSNAAKIAYPKAIESFHESLTRRGHAAIAAAAATLFPGTDNRLSNVLGDKLYATAPLTKVQTRKVFKRALRTAWGKS